MTRRELWLWDSGAYRRENTETTNTENNDMSGIELWYARGDRDELSPVTVNVLLLVLTLIVLTAIIAVGVVAWGIGVLLWVML